MQSPLKGIGASLTQSIQQISSRSLINAPPDRISQLSFKINDIQVILNRIMQKPLDHQEWSNWIL